MLAPSRVPVLFILFSRILYTKRAQRQMNFLSKNMSFLIISVSTLNYPGLEHFCPLDFASKIRPAHRTQNCETPRRNPAILPPEPLPCPAAHVPALHNQLPCSGDYRTMLPSSPHRQHRQHRQHRKSTGPPLILATAHPWSATGPPTLSRSAHLARRLTHRSGTTPPLAGNVRRHVFFATKKARSF